MTEFRLATAEEINSALFGKNATPVLKRLVHAIAPTATRVQIKLGSEYNDEDYDLNVSHLLIEINGSWRSVQLFYTWNHSVYDPAPYGIDYEELKPVLDILCPFSVGYDYSAEFTFDLASVGQQVWVQISP